jgi:type VI secretion system secreted protein Hcp
MPLNALMRISRAKGESRVKTAEKDFKDYIEIQGWEWEVEADTSWTKGGGASVGKPAPGKLSFEHYFDSSSTTILRFIFSGQSFDEVDLHMLKGTGDVKGQKEFFVMNMKDAFITKVTNTASDDGNVVQKVEMVFKEVTFTYKQQTDGLPQVPGGKATQAAGSLGAKFEVTWDIPAGKVK